MYQRWSIERNNRHRFTVGGLTTMTGDHAVERVVSVSQRASASARIHGNENDDLSKAFDSS